jgi:hypothetical protein
MINSASESDSAASFLERRRPLTTKKINQLPAFRRIRKEFKHAREVRDAFIFSGYKFNVEKAPKFPTEPGFEDCCPFLIFLNPSTKNLFLRFGSTNGHKDILAKEGERCLGGGMILKSAVEPFSYEGKDYQVIDFFHESSTKGGFSNRIIFGFRKELKQFNFISRLTVSESQKKYSGARAVVGLDLEEEVLTTMRNSREQVRQEARSLRMDVTTYAFYGAPRQIQAILP